LPIRVKSLGRRLLGGVGEQFGEGRVLAGLGVGHDAVLDRDLAGRNLPFGRGGGDEHGARAGAGLAELIPGIRDRTRSAGPLRAHQGVGVDLRVRGRVFEGHLRPVGVEFFGHDGCETHMRSLAHLQVLGDDDHRAIGIDLDEGAEVDGFPVCVRSEDVRGRAHHQHAAHQGADQHASAADTFGVGRDDEIHGLSP
jgi:hypothetical protein